MILMLQIFDVIANKNAPYKRNELELYINYASNKTELSNILGNFMPYFKREYNKLFYVEIPNTNYSTAGLIHISKTRQNFAL